MRLGGRLGRRRKSGINEWFPSAQVWRQLGFGGVLSIFRFTSFGDLLFPLVNILLHSNLISFFSSLLDFL